ncbi:MAG: hypothetical protein HY064_06120 [Bacteroidetes bacterium]|nr:hypothetical protein [Bacteroidota bacterium]
MKKFLVIAVIASSFLASCGNKGGTTSNTDSMGAPAAKTTQVKYQCPMKCQRDTTYDKPGNCPVCGMPMKEVK